MAAAQTRRYKYNRRVRVQFSWKPKDVSAAYTDNRTIHINTGYPLVTKTRGRENRYHLVCGLFAHELGHVLYTDFLQPQTQANFMERGLWYPKPPALHTAEDFANEKAMWAYLKADPKTRLRTVNLILVHCWEHIQDFCERFKAVKEAAESMTEAVKKSLDGMPGATTAGTGGAPVSGADGSRGGRIPYHQTSSVSEPVGGTTDYNADYEREQYDIVAPRLVTISKQLQRSIQKELKEHRQGGKQTGLVMGRRLDTHALCRNDGKAFYKNNLKMICPGCGNHSP